MWGSTMAGSTLEIDSGHKNEKIIFYPKSVRSFLRILCVIRIILIKSSFFLNKLTNITKHVFN